MFDRLISFFKNLWVKTKKASQPEPEPTMLFKLPTMEVQFENAPEKLREIAEYFCSLSAKNGVIGLVTRVTDHVDGDSGVHEAGRGIDFRNEYFDGKVKRWLLPLETVEEIVNAINKRYPRDDGHVTCMHHSFRGAPYHFHIQIRYQDLTKEEQGRKYGTVTGSN